MKAKYLFPFIKGPIGILIFLLFTSNIHSETLVSRFGLYEFGTNKNDIQEIEHKFIKRTGYKFIILSKSFFGQPVHVNYGFNNKFKLHSISVCFMEDAFGNKIFKNMEELQKYLIVNNPNQMYEKIYSKLVQIIGKKGKVNSYIGERKETYWDLDKFSIQFNREILQELSPEVAYIVILRIFPK